MLPTVTLDPSETLPADGYAGALAWSWTDVAPSRILAQIAATSAAHPADVLIVDSNTPVATITAPTNGAKFSLGANVTITADASDPDALGPQSVMDLGLKSLMCVRLKTQDRFSGLIYVDSHTRAKQFSDDAATRADGGDLGTFGKDMLPKAIEELVFSMKIGEIRGPVRADRGFHVIKLVERKVRDGQSDELLDQRDLLTVAMRRDLQQALQIGVDAGGIVLARGREGVGADQPRESAEHVAVRQPGLVQRRIRRIWWWGMVRLRHAIWRWVLGTLIGGCSDDEPVIDGCCWAPTLERARVARPVLPRPRGCSRGASIKAQVPL